MCVALFFIVIFNLELLLYKNARVIVLLFFRSWDYVLCEIEHGQTLTHTKVTLYIHKKQLSWIIILYITLFIFICVQITLSFLESCICSSIFSLKCFSASLQLNCLSGMLYEKHNIR